MAERPGNHVPPPPRDRNMVVEDVWDDIDAAGEGDNNPHYRHRKRPRRSPPPPPQPDAPAASQDPVVAQAAAADVDAPEHARGRSNAAWSLAPLRVLSRQTRRSYATPGHRRSRNQRPALAGRCGQASRDGTAATCHRRPHVCQQYKHACMRTTKPKPQQLHLRGSHKYRNTHARK
uniref:Uncharacterized protein n=1 Tax=Oryza brachyantha TaxID=4533 RepID=J3MVP8_ORYBR